MSNSKLTNEIANAADAMLRNDVKDDGGMNDAKTSETEQAIESSLSTVRTDKSAASDSCVKSCGNAETASVNDGAAPMCKASAECSEKKYIALSFDDGPNTTTTIDVLNKLEKYGVVATFFVIGDLITEETVPVMKRAHAMGCEYANHSKTHSFMDKMSAEEIKAEIEYTDKKIFDIVGEHTRFFRPPYIVVNETMYDAIELPFICGCGANDWEPPVSTEERAEGIISQMQNGAITLLHDMTGNDKTVNALDIIIPELLRQGFEFVTVSKVFELTGVKPQRNTLYSVTTQ